MTTIYVAGPMTGLPDFNYPAFDRAAADLFGLGYEVLNPVMGAYRDDAPRPGVEQDPQWQDYMRNGINQLIRADGVALLPGWLGSRGATIEVYLAHRLGLDVRDLTEWLANAKELTV